MGIVFFKIVGWFSYAVALLALLASIGLAIAGAAGFAGHPVEAAKPVKPALDKFFQSAREEQAQHPDEDADKSSPGAGKDDKTIQGKIDHIAAALDKFAAATGRDSIEHDDLNQYLTDGVDLDKEQLPDFLASLADESDKLAAKGAEIAKLPENSPERIDVGKFVKWYGSAYKDQLESEKARIGQQELEQAEKHVQAMTFLAAAGGAFALFVSFTMTLLMVKIEENTRKQSA